MAASKTVEQTTAVDLGALLDAGDGAVVTLAAGETRLAAHRAVLSSRSPVFEAMFRHDSLEACSGHVTIEDVEGPVLRQLVSYLYTLQAPQLPSMAPQLLAAADKYGLLGLKAVCEQQLAEQLAVENAAAVAVLALSHSCSELKEAAVAFVKAHTHEVMRTQGWAEAVFSHPHSVVELSCLLTEPPAKASAPPPPATSGGSPAPGTPCQSPPPDDAAVDRLRSLPAQEKASRLIQAAKEGQVQQLRALLAAGADVGARETEGIWVTDRLVWLLDRATALHWAAARGQVEAARCLLGAGAQVEARDYSWLMTPLHCAAARGHAAVVRLLLAEGSADPDVTDSTGWTPLHYVAYNGHAQAAAALLEAGADRSARTRKGQTPLDLARQENKQHLVQMLT